MPCAVCDGIIWDIRVLINKHLQLSHTNTQVRLVEPVRDVPTEGTKLASLLHQCMEKTEAKEKFLPYLWKLEEEEERRRGGEEEKWKEEEEEASSTKVLVLRQG